MLSSAGTFCISSYPQEFWTVSAEGFETGKYITQVCPLKYWRKKVPKLQLAWHAVCDTRKMLWISGVVWAQKPVMWQVQGDIFCVCVNSWFNRKRKLYGKLWCLSCSFPELDTINSLMLRVKFCQKWNLLWHSLPNRQTPKKWCWMIPMFWPSL